MAHLPINQPNKATDKELIDSIGSIYEELLQLINGQPNNQIYVGIMVDLISVYINELNRRYTDKNFDQIKQLNRLSKDNLRSSKEYSLSSAKASSRATWIAVVGVIIAISSIGLAITSIRSSDNWQGQQLNILRQIRDDNE